MVGEARYKGLRVMMGYSMVIFPRLDGSQDESAVSG